MLVTEHKIYGYEGYIITNKIGGKTLQEIMDMPREESIDFMRRHVNPNWGRPIEKKKKYKVRVRYRDYEYESIEAESKDELRQKIEEMYSGYDDWDFDILSEHEL